MTFNLEISAEAEDALRHAWGADLGRAALEALAIEGYRSGRLSRFEVQKLVGLSDRWATEEWLGAHGVHLNYTPADLDADRAALAQVFGPASH